MIIVIHFLFSTLMFYDAKTLLSNIALYLHLEKAQNTNGIHIGRSDGVNVLNTEIKTCDDCVSIRDGSKILVINGVTCGPGHGISIVSLELFKNEEPVDGVTIKNCTMTNTSNGVRIKSWPSVETGTCSNIHFECYFAL
ncbi:hypothetical protein Gotri_021996 [Gossypium trilobum]|uniref:Polygalacturonase n=1 Tax=Gossypium trilobum TaxID=34281 RepID=A0A7J9DEJ4_9ROSI|nr:hypothetical protein [Gossypium trilobum]